MIRRRLAVSGVAAAALVGEWLGHGIAYYRSAGLPGLRAGLGGGVHDYMIPLAVTLLVVAGAGAAWFARTWLFLGHRLDRAAETVRLLRAGVFRPARAPEIAVAPPAAMPSTRSQAIVLTLLLGLVQCALYLVQENLERVVHGLAGSGVAPLTDTFGAAAWIQVGTAALLAAVLTAAASLLRARHRAVAGVERRVRALWLRVWRAPVAAPARSVVHVVPCRLLLGCALWQRPPPLCSAV